MQKLYDDNDKTFTLSEIEDCLREKYGKSEHAYEAGACADNGEWLSVREILVALEEWI